MTLIESGVGAPAVPLGGLGAGLLEDPAAEVDDRPVSSADGMNSRGEIDAVLWVVPAEQRLEAFQLLVGDAGDRLVDDAELLLAEGRGQLEAEREPVHGGVARRLVEDLDAALALRLRAVHRYVCVP